MIGLSLACLLLMQGSPAAANEWQRLRTEAVAVSRELIAAGQTRGRSEVEAILAMLESKRPSIVQLGIERALKGSSALKEAAMKAAFARLKGFYVWTERDPYVQYLTIELFDPATGTLTYRGRGNRRSNGRVSSTIDLPEVSSPGGVCPAVFTLDVQGVARGRLACGTPLDGAAFIEIF